MVISSTLGLDVFYSPSNNMWEKLNAFVTNDKYENFVDLQM
jgi:hypothetical protein